MSDNLTNLTRRKMLGTLGVVGAGAVLGGAGTAAFFSDEETFKNNQLVAGSLDLKVDWEEHYYDGSLGEPLQFPILVGQPDGTDADYVGLPDPQNPLLWVHVDDLGTFMDATALEAFPDVDDDGLQDVSWNGHRYDACIDGADTPEDLDPTAAGALRTNNADTYDEEAQTVKPLVAIEDVKPGDFGELTLSFHLCDNPGYVWLQGALDPAMTSENGVTEPESKDPDEQEGVVELLQEIQTVWWYDSRGDNVLQTGCDETLYLIDNDGDSTALYEVTLDGDAELTKIWPMDGVPDNFQTSHIAATPSGDAIFFYDNKSGHLGRYTISDGSFDDLGAIGGDPGDVVLAGFSPTGDLWAASQGTDDLYIVDTDTPAVTSMGDTGIDLLGSDLVFASDGTLYIWTSADAQEGLYKVDDPWSDPTAVPVDASTIGSKPVRLTGLAILDSGTGNIVGSDRQNDDIVVIDRTDGSIVDQYPMTLGDGAFDHNYGDMTSAPYCGEVFFRGSLADSMAALSSGTGIPLDGNRASPFDEIQDDPTSPARECFVPGVDHYVGFAWYLPPDHANEIQTDSVGFDLGFYTEQCRHNDGAGLAPAYTQGTVGSGDFSQISYEKAFSMQALSRAGSGRGEIQIHGDSGGVENTTLWGPNPGDTFPADTDVPFTAVVDPVAETASLTINGVTVTDDDVTDGDANGAATGEPEWPSGVPDTVDIAVTAKSGDAAVTTRVSDLTVSGYATSPATIDAQDDLTYLELHEVPAGGTVTLTGVLRFEGSTGDFNGTTFVGIDWR